MKPVKSKKRNRRWREPFRVRAKRTGLKTVKAVALIGALPALAFAAWKGYNTLITTQYLSVIAVNVNGSERIPKEEIAALSGIKEGQNILSFETGQAEASIKTNPWIEDAKVERSYPDVIDIEVRERSPVALVKLDVLYVMDSSGVVFKKYAPDDDLDLPIVTGLTMAGLMDSTKVPDEGLMDLIGVLSARAGFNIAKVSEISVDPVFGFSIYTLEEGVRLDVGRDSFEEKLSAFERVLGTRNGGLRGIEAFDLYNPRAVTVRFNTNVVQEGGGTDGQKG